jgi:hypothetical protein
LRQVFYRRADSCISIDKQNISRLQHCSQHGRIYDSVGFVSADWLIQVSCQCLAGGADKPVHPYLILPFLIKFE